MKRMLSTWIGLALALSLEARAGATPTEDLFKWGEYDSLIRVLEPAASKPESVSRLSSQADSLERAKSLLFLGVAFFATNKPDRADQAFTMACTLDPEVKLDRFYVTEEISARFQAILRESLRRRQQEEALEAAKSGGMARSPNAGKQGALRQGGNDKAWLWWGMGVSALVAAGGGAFWYASRDAEAENVTTIDIRNPK